VAELGKSLGKNAYNVSQTSGFGKRYALRSNKDNFHGASVVTREGQGSTMLRKF
jgi:hypothetical protein